MAVLLAMVFVVASNVLSMLGNERQTHSRRGRVRRLFTEDSGDAGSTEEQQSAWTPAPSRRVE